jgi:hypothetical protein
VVGGALLKVAARRNPETAEGLTWVPARKEAPGAPPSAAGVRLGCGPKLSVPVDRPGAGTGGCEIEEDEAIEQRGFAHVDRGKEAMGKCAMKYAAAMKPERMKATGRVNRPSAISQDVADDGNESRNT